MNTALELHPCLLHPCQAVFGPALPTASSAWPSPAWLPFPLANTLFPTCQLWSMGHHVHLTPSHSPISNKDTRFLTLLYCSWGEGMALDMKKPVSQSHKLGDWVRRQQGGHLYYLPLEMRKHTHKVGQSQTPGRA